jgi:hypothetical protein
MTSDTPVSFSASASVRQKQPPEYTNVSALVWLDKAPETSPEIIPETN